jgi:SH3-like domain-containing protein
MRCFGFVLLICVIVSVCGPELARALCVTAPIAKLRAGPSVDHRVTWTVGQYMPLREIGKKGSWYQVQDMDGEKHWIHRESVSTKIQCVAVKAKVATLRKGPGRKFPASEIPTVDKYTPFLKIQREGDWLQVQDEYRETYWVADNQVWWPVTRMAIKF